VALEDKICEHKELFYNEFDKQPIYQCFGCDTKMQSTYAGGKLDLSEYTTNVAGYNSLRLVRTNPKEQLRLDL
jgi:hypothetical protein